MKNKIIKIEIEMPEDLPAQWIIDILEKTYHGVKVKKSDQSDK